MIRKHNYEFISTKDAKYELTVSRRELEQLSEVLGQHAKLKLWPLYRSIVKELHREQEQA